MFFRLGTFGTTGLETASYFDETETPGWTELTIQVRICLL